MDIHRYSSPSLFFFLLFMFMFIISSQYTTAAIGTIQQQQGEEEKQQQQEQLQMEAKTRTPIMETVKTMFSFPFTLSQPFTTWEKLKSLIIQCKAYFSSPTVDFRDSSQEAQSRDGAAAGEKVKEAVIKSLDKSKATMEDTAKSAARLAEDAMHKTRDKVKSTFSFGDGEKEQVEEEL